MLRILRRTSQYIRSNRIDLSTLTGLKQLDQADEHCIQIRTCRKVYSEKKGFLFFNAPNQGIDIEVKYLDTDPSAPPSIPVVLAVHGAPGSYYDFEEMIAFLKNQGVRIVAANFPDLSLIRERGIFKHTNEERSEFLHDWLKEIGVNRVDVAITHSSGVYSTIKLWQENHNLIKSLVMLNPAGHRRATAMKPAWMMNTAAYLYVTGVGRELFHSLFVHLVRALGSKVKIDEDNILNALLTCMTMTFAGVETFASTLKELSMRKTPTCYLYSEKDKLIDTIIYKEMVQILGSNLSDVFIVSNDGKNLNKESPILNHTWLKIINMKNGGHYAFRSCTKLLCEEVSRLIHEVSSSERMIISEVFNDKTGDRQNVESHEYQI